MSAECPVCWRDMGYGELGVPVCDYCERVEELNDSRTKLDKYRGVLDYMADDANWLGNPHTHDAMLLGHDTPFELARRVLLEPSDE